MHESTDKSQFLPTQTRLQMAIEVGPISMWPELHQRNLGEMPLMKTSPADFRLAVHV